MQSDPRRCRLRIQGSEEGLCREPSITRHLCHCASPTHVCHFAVLLQEKPVMEENKFSHIESE